MGKLHLHGKHQHSHAHSHKTEKEAEKLPPNMAKLKQRASYVGACVNIMQTLIKITFGILGQSAALIADGIHSLSDLMSDALVITAVRLGSREADKEHPYGHRRFETIAGVILGGSLIFIGGGIGWSVYERMSNPETLPVPNELSLAITAVSILLNEWLYHYTKRIAKITRSKLLLANAWHQRSDAFSSIVVLIGIGAVMLGYPLADAIAAIIVALLVIKIGLNLMIEGIKELVDTALPDSLVAEIRTVIYGIDGVEDIHLLRTRYMGEDALIDAHIIVDPRISVSEGHRIGDMVRDELIARFDDVMEVLVHVDPENDEAFATNIRPLTRANVQELLTENLPELLPYLEDFRIHYLEHKIEIELIIPFALSIQSELIKNINVKLENIKHNVPQIETILLFFKHDCSN
jgi:cation diffusion facilitator family transporter